MPARPADQAVTTPFPTVREAAQRVVDAREANKRACLSGDKHAMDDAMYTFEDAFAELRVVLAQADALTGSAPLCSTCGKPRDAYPPICSNSFHVAAPGAVETPHLQECIRTYMMFEADSSVPKAANAELAALKESREFWKTAWHNLDQDRSASPSAERILTQATDETIKACSVELAKRVGDGAHYVEPLMVAKCLREFFPTRSGAAVVPSEGKLRDAIEDALTALPWGLYGAGRDTASTHAARAVLAASDTLRAALAGRGET